MDTALQPGSCQSRMQGENYLPQPADHITWLSSSTGCVGFLDCKDAVLSHVELPAHQDPQALLRALNLVIPQPVLTGLLRPRCSTSYLALLAFLGFSHWTASPPSSMLATPHSLVSSGNLMRVHSVPLSMQLTKMSSSVDPKTKPQGTSLVTAFHSDTEPLTATPCVCPSSQFLMHQAAHRSNPCLSSLETRILYSFSFCRY